MPQSSEQEKLAITAMFELAQPVPWKHQQLAAPNLLYFQSDGRMEGQMRIDGGSLTNCFLE